MAARIRFRSQLLTRKLKRIEGINNLAEHLNQLGDAVDGEAVIDTLYRAARMARDEIRDLAPEDPKWAKGASVKGAVFAYRGHPHKDPQGPSVLFGVSKKKSMLEWTAGKHPKHPRAKIPPGGKVAMSLATMFEYGTTQLSARPFFRPAMAAIRPMAARVISEGVGAAIKKALGTLSFRRD